MWVVCHGSPFYVWCMNRGWYARVARSVRTSREFSSIQSLLDREHRSREGKVKHTGMDAVRRRRWCPWNLEFRGILTTTPLTLQKRIKHALPTRVTSLHHDRRNMGEKVRNKQTRSLWHNHLTLLALAQNNTALHPARACLRVSILVTSPAALDSVPSLSAAFVKEISPVLVTARTAFPRRRRPSTASFPVFPEPYFFHTSSRDFWCTTDCRVQR